MEPLSDATSAPPPRPLPDRPLSERAHAWLAWFGLPRLAATAACMLVVAAGGWWLVRAPAPPPEAGLSRSSVVSSPAVTLPAPADDTSPPPPDQVDRTSAPSEVIVHVAGEVRQPGVYLFADPPRVHDAIQRAGGPSPAADLDALNLAAPLADGQRLYVPARGDVQPGRVLPLEPPSGSAVAEGTGGATSAPIDLNRATATELDALPGVGPATAGAIVDDRDRNGPFARVDDLERVPGIGPAKLAALRELVTV